MQAEYAQTRVLNLTATSAAWETLRLLAGALFVLEIPHRMGYNFERFVSCNGWFNVAVLYRMVIGNDVTGYYSYPFSGGICFRARYLQVRSWHGLFGAGGIIHAMGDQAKDMGARPFTSTT
jgi:hypothetical protein